MTAVDEAVSPVAAAVDKAVDECGLSPAALIPVLQDVSNQIGYLPEEALRRVAERLDVPLTRVYHVATFYRAFSLDPRGRHTIKICVGTACHVRGAPQVVDELRQCLGIGGGETTPDGEFTVETVNCLGACALGPVIVIDDAYYRAAPGSVAKLLQAFRERGEAPELSFDGLRVADVETRQRLASRQTQVTVCGGTGCMAYGCQAVAEAFAAALKAAGLSAAVELIQTGCHGFCERGPVVVLRPSNVFYQRVKVDDVAEIIARSILADERVERLLYRNADGSVAALEGDIPFYRAQHPLVFRDNAHVSPTSIDHFIDRCDGYAALQRALTMPPESIIDLVTKAGLRGRGGGGFPAGLKWAICRKVAGDVRYVICNADEGDPGAYMDRSLLEGSPHRIIEGMVIGARAIGATAGYVYVRAEYPLAVEHLLVALEQARERGYLGSDICGSGMAFDIQAVRGGGAFICGESTALIASLEGKAGEPRATYVYPVETGLWDRPTVINNVETWANVPGIIQNGAEAFAALGTKTSKGTKIFSLVGKVVNTGLVEVPMGTTLRQIVFDIGGGIPDGRQFKAVQTGGPSGGCLPADSLDLPIGFDELLAAGSMMGSGGLIVMDDRSCMVDVTKYFLSFLLDESCGKCVPCREGIAGMLEILRRITEGNGREDDIERLEQIAPAVVDGSLCALGGSAPNPVLSTLRHFRAEYDAHIREKRCPAKVCRALITFRILPEACTGCTACRRRCPVQVISGEKKKPHVIDPSGCIKCGACLQACRFNAVEVV